MAATRVPRSEHSISRRDIDPDALTVLYRLHRAEHVAYLVGGSVRDLLVGRHPKDFDIGTNAHPQQVKRLFRNCWIIGRRFRLAHVKFGQKVIEVATFRRRVPEAEAAVQAEAALQAEAAVEHADPAAVDRELGTGRDGPGSGEPRHERIPRRDNTFGTPEEDAFRRDFTVNALFYDIGTFSIIDYVGGLEDLRAGLIRSIGDPRERFPEDPVRMIRAVALAARLGFRLDQPVIDAIAEHRALIARSSPARLLDEFYKILRTGAAEPAFRGLAEAGLLAPISAALQAGASDRLWQSLGALDAYRRRSPQPPNGLTNAILLGSLVVPLGFTADRGRREGPDRPPALGALPVARRDVEQLRQILTIEPRLREPGRRERAQRSLLHRGAFPEALTWLEIHGDAPAEVARWKGLSGQEGDPAEPRAARRRRRRRRRGPANRPVPEG